MLGAGLRSLASNSAHTSLGVVVVKVIVNSLVLMALACGSRNVATAEEREADATVFKAESLLIVRPSAPLMGAPGTRSAAEDRAYANTQRVLLKSPFILTAALRQPGVAELSLVKDQEEPLDWLAKSIQCAFIDDSSILRVSLSGNNPHDPKAIVDAVVEAYLKEIAQAERTEAAKRLQTLRIHRRDNEQIIREKAEIIHHLAEEMGSADSKQIRLLHELNFHELRLLLDRRERLTSKMDDVSDELDVLAALSSESTDSPRRELQKQTRVLKLRKEQLSARIAAVEARIAESRQALTQSIGFSSDLEARRSDIKSLQEANHHIVESIVRMELELKAEPRVQRIQPAFVTKIDNGSSGQKDKAIQERE